MYMYIHVRFFFTSENLSYQRHGWPYDFFFIGEKLLYQRFD